MHSDDARDRLLEILEPGATVYTILRHVSQSGMSRDISAMVIREGQPFLLDGLMASTGRWRRSRRRYGEGLYVGGAGMDMGFSLVYGLSSYLWPDGHPCAGERCRSNDHSNDYNRLAAEWNAAHGKVIDASQVAERQAWIAAQHDACHAPTRMHSDGGYALSQRWL